MTNNGTVELAVEARQAMDSHSPEVYRAICQVAKEVSRDGIGKGGRNQQQGYAFRGIDDVMNALSPLLAGADLCILPKMLSRTQEERVAKAGGALFAVVVEAAYDFICGRDGSRHTVITFGEAMDTADKATNKAMSAAYKYAVMQAFCIPTEGSGEDADGLTHEPAPKTPAPRPPAPAKAAAAVAEEKIRTGNTDTKKPWTNRGEMKRAFGQLREVLGEVTYSDELARYGVDMLLNWKSANQAVECWHCMAALAITAVA